MDGNLQKPPPQQPIEPQMPVVQPQVPLQQPPSGTEMRPIKKATSFSMVSIVVIILAIAGYIALASSYDLWPFEKEMVVEEIPTPTATIDLTVNWDIYENKIIGFRFKYPNGVVIEPDIELRGDEYLNFIVYRNDELLEDMKTNPGRYAGDIAGTTFVTIIEGKTIDELITASGDQFSDREVEKETILINGLTAIRVTITTARYDDWISVEVYFQKDNLVVRFGNGAIIENIRPMGKIVETFELIK